MAIIGGHGPYPDIVSEFMFTGIPPMPPVATGMPLVQPPEPPKFTLNEVKEFIDKAEHFASLIAMDTSFTGGGTKKSDGKVSRQEVDQFVSHGLFAETTEEGKARTEEIGQYLLANFDDIEDNKTGKTDGILSKKDLELEAEIDSPLTRIVDVESLPEMSELVSENSSTTDE